jgi:hypothetical protein
MGGRLSWADSLLSVDHPSACLPAQSAESISWILHKRNFVLTRGCVHSMIEMIQILFALGLAACLAQ